MKLRVLVVSLAIAAAGAAASIGQAPGDSAEARVRATVDTYLYGLKHNDVASLRKAFWPEARLFLLKKDKSVGQLSQAEALYQEYRKIPARVGPLELKSWGRREFHMIVPSGVCLQFYEHEVA